MKTAIRVVLVSTAIWILVGLATFAQTLWIGVASPRDAAQLSVLEWSPWVIFSPLIILFARVLPITTASWKWSVPLHFVASLLVAAAAHWITMTTSRLWASEAGSDFTFVAVRLPASHGTPRGVSGPPDPRLLFETAAPLEGGAAPPMGPGADFITRPPLFAMLFMGARLTLPIYWLVVVATHAWRHHGIALEREGRALRAEREVVRARLAALQTQLQPHFLFNSLNAISAFIAKRPAAADNMVCALSDLLRSVLNMSERTEIPLSDELEFARRYLAVQRIRFDDTLRIAWYIAPEVQDALVPTLLLQPLLENALEHGLGGSAGDLEVRADARRDHLHLTVTNRSDHKSGHAAPVKSSTRVGLRNTRARLEALFGAAYRLELCDVPGGARAEIELPLRRAAA